MIKMILYNATTQLDKYYIKWVSIFGVSIVGAVEGLLSAVNSTIIFFIPTVVVVLVDMWTAISLNKRVAKKYPHLVSADHGKPKSQPGSKAVMKIVKMFSGIVIGSFVDQLGLFPDNSGVHTVFIGFLLTQIWSIFENTSSENDSRWAEVAQVIFMNKASRHLNVDRGELEKILMSKTDTDDWKNKKHIADSIDTGSNSNNSDNNASVSKDTEPDNRGKSKDGQPKVNGRKIQWRDGSKYDIEAYRGVLQELNRQLDESREGVSEGA